MFLASRSCLLVVKVLLKNRCKAVSLEHSKLPDKFFCKLCNTVTWNLNYFRQWILVIKILLNFLQVLYSSHNTVKQTWSNWYIQNDYVTILFSTADIQGSVFILLQTKHVYQTIPILHPWKDTCRKCPSLNGTLLFKRLVVLVLEH